MSKYKVLLRGIKSNLFSFCMVFFSTLLVVVVLTVNFSFEQSVVGTRLEQLREAFLNTQILISKTPEVEKDSTDTNADKDANTNKNEGADKDTNTEAEEDESKSEYFQIHQIQKILNQNDKIVAWVESLSFQASTQMKTKLIDFYSIDLYQQKSVYPIDLLEGSDDFTEENGVIISETFAKDNSLKLNDKFTFYLNQSDRKTSGENGTNQGSAAQESSASSSSSQSANAGFEAVVKGIAPDSGIFRQAQNLIIAKLAYGQKVLNKPGKLNGVDIEIADLALITATTDELNEQLQALNLNLQALQYYDEEYYDSYVSTVVLALNLFVGVMVLVSIYIILSVFRSYVYQNMREMVTLRSIGFSIQNYRFMILGQVLLISLVSSLLGLALSYPGVVLLMSIFIGDASQSQLNLEAAVIIIACVCAISTLSAWLATRKVTRTPIIDILKKNLVQKKDSARIVTFSLSLFICFLAVAFLYLADLIGVIAYFAAVGLGLIAFILLHDYLVFAFSRLIEFLFGRLPRTIGLFAKQLKFNCGSYTQSISIISLVLVVSTLAVSISTILDEALSSVFEGSDIAVGIYSQENTDYDKAVAVLNKEQVPSYVIQKRKEVAINNKWVEISGVPIDKYVLKNYERVIGGSREEIFSRLNDENTIIITTTFAKNHSKKVGDSVPVEGKDLKIVGIVNSFENMGNVLFVSDKNFDGLFKEYDYCLALVDTDNLEATREFLDTELGSSEILYSVSSVQEIYEETASSNRLIINIIYFLCAFSLVISSISMISNLIINMVSRRSDFLIYRTIGLTKKNIRRIVFFEALSMGLYSGGTGIAMGCILLPVLSAILSYYIGSVEYSFHLDIMAGLMGVACVIAVFSALWTVHRYVFKMNLIEEIKRV